MPTKEYNARILVKLTDDLLPAPMLSKTELEAHLTEALEIANPETPILSVTVHDPSDTRTRRR